MNGKRFNNFTFLKSWKYEIMLFALLQHLFIGIFLQDLPFYIKYIWPINMVFLGIANIGLFSGKSLGKNKFRFFITFLVIALPILAQIIGNSLTLMIIVSVAYLIFFGFIFVEVIQYLIKPSYINIDIITASACGYFLLIEIFVFLTQSFYYLDPNSLKGINIANPAATYIDIVYFACITLTSIGFGDILPNSHNMKLLTSLFGIIGQFYSVVLVGILISKFTSREK